MKKRLNEKLNISYLCRESNGYIPILQSVDKLLYWIWYPRMCMWFYFRTSQRNLACK